jgi:hypothetical protein
VSLNDQNIVEQQDLDLQKNVFTGFADAKER